VISFDCRFLYVTITTANIAFLDFSFDHFPGTIPRRHDGNTFDFFASNMIEFENNGIAFSAINTRILP